MEVISLSKDKVKIMPKTVLKKTNDIEFKNLLEAKEFLKHLKNLKINGVDYCLQVPKIFDYTEGNLLMERCFGNNIELGLRNYNKHAEYVKYINDIFEYIIKNNFYWLDFAPRNIIMNENNIYLFDFERGFLNSNKKAEEYLTQPNVYEEYGAFLLPKERLFNLEYLKVTMEGLNLNEINSKRVKMILKAWGYDNLIPFPIYLKALQKIIEVETPIKENGTIKFPIVDLEDFIIKNGHDEYIKLILRR